jgi:GntR family transcriptional regulator
MCATPAAGTSPRSDRIVASSAAQNNVILSVHQMAPHRSPATALPAAAIDRDSPVPFYFQLAELLEHEIVSGRWRREERLPSEPDLCDHFGVSRTTVRQALARLEHEGLVNRSKGRGTFVLGTRTRSWLLQSSEGFFDDEAVREGRTVTSKVLRAMTGPLPPWAADALQLAPGSEGVTIERVRSVDGTVAMYNVNHLPGRLAAAALARVEDPGESLYRRLKERAGIEVAGANRTLEAVSAEQRLAKLLEVKAGTPLLYIESVAWDQSGERFDCYQSWLRTDHLRIDIRVSPLRG